MLKRFSHAIARIEQEHNDHQLVQQVVAEQEQRVPCPVIGITAGPDVLLRMGNDDQEDEDALDRVSAIPGEIVPVNALQIQTNPVKAQGENSQN